MLILQRYLLKFGILFLLEHTPYSKFIFCESSNNFFITSESQTLDSQMLSVDTGVCLYKCMHMCVFYWFYFLENSISYLYRSSHKYIHYVILSITQPQKPIHHSNNKQSQEKLITKCSVVSCGKNEINKQVLCVLQGMRFASLNLPVVSKCLATPSQGLASLVLTPTYFSAH